MDFYLFELFLAGLTTFIQIIFIFQGEIDGLMRQHPHLLHPKQHQHSMNQLNSRALPKQPTTNTQSNLNSRRQLPAIQHSRNQERSFSGEEYSNKFYNSLDYDCKYY